jgi:hypothetical protein
VRSETRLGILVGWQCQVLNHLLSGNNSINYKTRRFITKAGGLSSNQHCDVLTLAVLTASIKVGVSIRIKSSTRCVLLKISFTKGLQNLNDSNFLLQTDYEMPVTLQIKSYAYMVTVHMQVRGRKVHTFF